MYKSENEKFIPNSKSYFTFETAILLFSLRTVGSFHLFGWKIVNFSICMNITMLTIWTVWTDAT